MFDNPGQQVVEMIVKHREPGEILEVLCDEAGNSEEERQVAFFLLDGDAWRLAAKGRLTVSSEAALAEIVPEDLSAALSGPGDGSFDQGWACHLVSGSGELLGVFAYLCGAPAVPCGSHAVRVASACHLAALALEQKNLLDDLTWQADHDAVTGAYTRTFFERMLEWRLHVCPAAVLYIGLDRFRLVNDVLGHAMGNRVLRLVAQRFQSVIESGDVLAREGGDEFVVLLGQTENPARTADSLLLSLSEPFPIDGHELFISASIGISRSRQGGTAESLEREAYIALYHAKQNGKARGMQFDPAMAVTPPERLEMEKRLRAALAGGEMLLYYQPQIELSSGFVDSAEALLRWQPHGLGIIAPASFVPILEETGLILEFGRWVLQETCRQGQEWTERTGRALRLAVNVSAVQFASPGFVNDVEKILSVTGFPPELLELELTESILISDYARACRIFRELRKTGISLALDDFGTGQSSLTYLRELPFEKLKVDRSFISPLQEGRTVSPLLKNILDMASGLGMTSVAEGIETSFQADTLQAMGCHLAQGYFYSAPLPPAQFAEFLANDSRAPRNGPSRSPLILY